LRLLRFGIDDLRLDHTVSHCSGLAADRKRIASPIVLVRRDLIFAFAMA
jgi:hypothetical protein